MRIRRAGVAILAVVLLSGCNMLGLGGDDDGGANPVEPTSPSGSAFLGGWQSSSTSGGASLDDCSQLTWQATGVQGSTIFGSFTATCAGFQVVGTGTGTPQGSNLDWTALGTGSQGSVTCPFTLSGTISPQGAQRIELVFTGTVCGIAVRGTEELIKS